MDLIVIIAAVCFGVIFVEKLTAPKGILSFLPNLIYVTSRLVLFFLPIRAYNNVKLFIHRVIDCHVCITGWFIITYSIYLGSWEFFFLNTFTAMFLATITERVINKFL